MFLGGAKMDSFGLTVVAKRRFFLGKRLFGLTARGSKNFILPPKYVRVFVVEDRYVFAYDKLGNVEKYFAKVINDKVYLGDMNMRYIFRRGNERRIFIKEYVTMDVTGS